MAFFQNSVLNKHLKGQDAETIKIAYQKFTAYFHNPVIQQNIRDAKEEQFQERFLRELFVNILGYTLNPHAEYNLTTELKNEKGAKKADGAILQDGKALGVIELKGTDTKDLDKINVQAFNYKNNQRGCIYVITSNFEKLRFFIHHSVEHLEFNLFTLTESEFQLLWLCLSADNLLNGVPLKIKEESLLVEERITKQLYKDYAAFRNDLWQNMVKNSHAKDKLLLFKKTQKLLDRYLFIFFAEDSGLLPPNSISRIVKRWEVLKQEDAYKPLYDIFKQYFGYIDTGRKGQKSVDDIFAYNGGLFQPDEVLDNIVLDDEMLHPNVMKLTNYDFQSEVDVNILGHIFENSLNEIENITAELEGQEVDKTKSKRKKDGVFYTPKYITKYIVDNTVGKLCEEKKIELGIIDEEYAKGRRNRKKDIIIKLGENLQAYRNWLLNITICDPACGSGAFLNQALEFLMEEHAYVDELQAQLFGASIVFQDVSNHILEKNIYGVDINEESVDIAKLSLWLRTAQRGRKLTTLNNNIKCGNSLINDSEVAEEKAFKWQKEFPNVFEKGGFDVVIGNPPYVPTEYISENDKVFLEKTYNSAFGRINLYPIFYEKGILILRDNGVLSYITPYTILKNQYYKEARKFILENTSINVLIDFKGNLVFEDAAVDSIILSLRKKKVSGNKFLQIFNIKNFLTQHYSTAEIIQDDILKSDDLSFNISVNEKLITRISKNCTTVSKVINFNQGIITGGNSKYLTQEVGALTKKMITGSDFNRYTKPESHSYIIYDTDKLHRPRKKEIFEVAEKILLRQTGAYPICTIDLERHYTLDTVHNGLIIDENYSSKYLLALFNSKLFRFLYENSINEGGKVFAQVKIIYIDPLPIKIAKEEIQKPFIIKVEEIISFTSQLKMIQSSLIGLFQSKFEIEKLTTKLQNWHELEFGDFLKELKKAKVQLSLSEEAEWMQYFNEQKQRAQTLKTEINRIDAQIDKMVYELYGLTDEEIKIVEGE